MLIQDQTTMSHTWFKSIQLTHSPLKLPKISEIREKRLEVEVGGRFSEKRKSQAFYPL